MGKCVFILILLHISIPNVSSIVVLETRGGYHLLLCPFLFRTKNTTKDDTRAFYVRKININNNI